MSERLSRPPSTYLEPPRKSVELEDPGAQESASNSDDEHFSDASEGHQRPFSHPPSGRASPVPRTRVVKVDYSPRYGEVPGTPAYEKREKDAVPDEIEVIPEGFRSHSHSRVDPHDRPLTPGGTPIPRTLVEKIDPSSPSYGDVPGTPAYEKRKADAVPDLVLKIPEPPSSKSPSLNPEAESSAANSPLPETRLSRVDSLHREPDLGFQAHRRSPSDALPDAVVTVQDGPDSQTSALSSYATHPSHTRRKGSLTTDHDHNIGDDNDNCDDDCDETVDRGEETIEPEPFHEQETMDEFDDFTQGQEGADDDFGDFDDFDDGFQEPEVAAEEDTVEKTTTVPQQPLFTPSVPPLVDFDSFHCFSDLSDALDRHLSNLFPASKDVASLPPIEPIQDSTAIFSSERSLSLWSQLVAPPPLQPQNWVKSRIRRLFLVSLGVPVDLDEILPASKQKKLVLPSINLDGSDGTGHSYSLSQLKKDGVRNGSETSLGSGQGSRQKSSRRRGTSRPPELDLSAVRRLCATTDAALDGLTDDELRTHVKDLEQATLRASSVLEYWLKKRDGLVSEKEAFEGVIENLVNHARRVRK